MKVKGIAAVLAFSMINVSYADEPAYSAEAIEFVSELFTGSEQYSKFYRMDEIFPVDRVQKSSRPIEWPVGKALDLPAEYSYEGKSHSTQSLLTETETAALLVIKDGQIRYENYWLTGGKNEHWMSMSVAKSFVSALYGVAVEEGIIQSIDDAASKYLPALKGSGYDGVRIKDILQMSSGVHWSEDYSDPDSEIMRLGPTMATGSSYIDFVKTIRGGVFEPGTFNRYCSADTLVLGLILEAASGKSLAQYTHENLWQPLGATKDAYWIKDNSNHTMAFAGLNATARDYARLGEMYRLNGRFNGKQIVPADWVKASITPDAPHLMPGKRDSSDSSMGYGYQWWLPEGGEHDFAAIGVYNQFVYVHPDQNTVIVKLSASRNYGATDDETSWREQETIEFFREVAKNID